METPAPPASSWKSKYPAVFGAVCGVTGALALGAGGGVIWWSGHHAAPASPSREAEDQRIESPSPSIAAPDASSGSQDAAAPEAEELPAACRDFVAKLEVLLGQTKVHAEDLRQAAAAAYLAGRSSEIDPEALAAKAGLLKQDLATFDETYPQIEPLISALTPDQISRIGAIKEQFAKYQRLSERFDRTLASIGNYRRQLADSENAASGTVAAVDETAPEAGTTTETTTMTVTSQPGSVYTDPVYYYDYYDTNPALSVWLGYSYWPSWYYYPYHKDRFYKRPPAPPKPDHNPPHHHPQPNPGNLFPGNPAPAPRPPTNPSRPQPHATVTILPDSHDSAARNSVLAPAARPVRPQPQNPTVNRSSRTDVSQWSAAGNPSRPTQSPPPAQAARPGTPPATAPAPAARSTTPATATRPVRSEAPSASQPRRASAPPAARPTPASRPERAAPAPRPADDGGRSRRR
jgi:hypothetical protein